MGSPLRKRMWATTGRRKTLEATSVVAKIMSLFEY